MSAPNKYSDPFWSELSSKTESKLGLPEGLLATIVSHGERSNNDQVSEAGARTPFQITPGTRKLAIDKYGIDPYLNPENAAEVAGLLLKDSLKRNNGDVSQAVGEYHGGTNRKNWGPRTKAYITRVSDGLEAKQIENITNDFQNWLAEKNKQAETAQPEQNLGYGKRGDGTEKGNGFLGVLQRPDGGVSTELGVGVNIDGKETEIPLLVPTLTEKEKQELLSVPADKKPWDVLPNYDEIERKAIDHAKQRMAEGKPTFAQPNESPNPEDEFNAGLQNWLAEKNKPKPEKGTGYDFGPNDSVVASSVMHPIQAVGKASDWLTNQVNTAAGIPEQYDNPNPLLGVDPERQAAAAFNVAGLGQTGAIAPTAVKAVEAVKSVAQPAKEMLNRVVGRAAQEAPRVDPTSPQSGGAAAVQKAMLNKIEGESLPVPIKNQTKGQLLNDLDQQQFEKNIAKQPEGRKLLDTFEEHNAVLAKNFDKMIESKGVDVESELRATGLKVDSALKKEIEKAKTQINHEFAIAERSPESKKPVDPSSFVKLLNELKSSEGNSGVITAAKNELVRLGGAYKEDGKLVVGWALTIPEFYKIRTLINKNTKFEGPDLHFAPILKKEIDKIMTENGGELYKKANASYAKFASKFKNRAVINNLVKYKPGTEDRKVAFEDVFKHSILEGSMDDVVHLKKILKGASGGSHGLEAWHDLQAQTLAHIRNQAFKNEGRNTRGDPIISSKKLNDVLHHLDRGGKLDVIFTKKEADDLRTLLKFSRTLFNAPPGAINNSDTATIVMRALNDGVFGLFKMPVPLLKASLKYAKDRQLRNKILEALNYHKKVR